MFKVKFFEPGASNHWDYELYTSRARAEMRVREIIENASSGLVSSSPDKIVFKDGTSVVIAEQVRTDI